MNQGSLRNIDTDTFIDELCRYYTEFLNSDFKTGRLPKRQIKTKDSKGRRVGVNIQSFDNFYIKLFKEFNQNIPNGVDFKIPKQVYLGTIPKSLSDVINILTENISTDSFLTQIKSELLLFFESQDFNGQQEYFREKVFDLVKKSLSQNFFNAFLGQMDEYIDDKSLNPINSLIETEEDLIYFSTDPIFDQSSESLMQIIVEKNHTNFFRLPKI